MNSKRQLGFVALAFLLAVACSKPRNRHLLDQHRNLGKAFYENPTTQQEAVGEFQQALAIAPDSARDKLNYALALLKVPGREAGSNKAPQEVQRQDPTLPHTWFNLGIYYKHQGDAQRAIAQFEGMLARTPDEAIAHYQLGTLYNQTNRRQEAQAQFEKAAELDPSLAAARFQLYNLHRLAGNAGQADRYLADFERIKNLQKSWVIPENVEWCDYAEIYDPPEARAEAAAPPEPKFADTRLDGTVDPATAGLTLIDSTGSGQTDLLVWSSQGIRLFLKGQRPAAATGLEGLTGVIDVAPGDFNNDGLMDLCVLTQAGPVLYRNTGGKFVRQPAKLPARRFDAAVWIDYDHDYDLDLLLLGRAAGAIAESRSGGMGGSDRGFPVCEGRGRFRPKTARGSRQQSFRSGSVLSRSRAGAVSRSTGRQIHRGGIPWACPLRIGSKWMPTSTQPGGWTVPASMRTAAFIFCAIRATKTITGSVFSSRACEVSSWLRMRWSR